MADFTKGVVGYNTVLKLKERKMTNVVINCTKNRFVAVGQDALTGQNMAAICSRANAEIAVKEGHATKGQGW